MVNVHEPLAAVSSSTCLYLRLLSSAPQHLLVECMNDSFSKIFLIEKALPIEKACSFPRLWGVLLPCLPRVPSAFLHPALDMQHSTLYASLRSSVWQCLPRELSSQNTLAASGSGFWAHHPVSLQEQRSFYLGDPVSGLASGKVRQRVSICPD